MPATTAITATVWEDGSPVVMMRVLDKNKVPITQGGTSTINWKAVDQDDPTTDVVASTPLTVANVVFDTLQTTTDDPRWTVDSSAKPGEDGYNGYNFLYQLPPTAVPDGKKTYIVQFQFTDSASVVSFGEVKLKTKPQYFT
jgi:hypothetical protein